MIRTTLKPTEEGADPLSQPATPAGSPTKTGLQEQLGTPPPPPPAAAASTPARGGDATSSKLDFHIDGPLAPTPRSAGPAVTASSSSSQAAVSTSGTLLPSDPDDIVLDYGSRMRARSVSIRHDRGQSAAAAAAAPNHSHTTGALAAGLASAASARAAAALVTGTPPVAIPSSIPAAAPAAAAAAASPVPAPAPASPARPAGVVAVPHFKLPLRSRDWHPSPELTKVLVDDWDSHGRVPGEHPVMQIPDVLVFSAHDDAAQVTHSLLGTLFMSSYQLFLEPTQRRDRLGQAVMALPLSTIERIELDKASAAKSSSSSSGGGNLGQPQRHYLDVYSKDGRLLRFGFSKHDECKRSYDCLMQYVFPAKDEYMFAWSYKLKVPLPAHLDGWNVYDPLMEFLRQGINTTPLATPDNTNSTALRVSWVNENYTLCPTYPRVLVVPSERFISDVDLLVVAQFRSRGRIPVCTWKHPASRQCIWRCSQPRVGINNTRSPEDEKLLHALTGYPVHGDMFAIFDARPRFNARANILAGKGFENPELYKNAVKKVAFLDIHNIHVMRDSCAKMVKACMREAHNTHEGGNASFVSAVAASGWLSHIATCLKATAEMVKAIDQDKLSLLVHCSDGWDRTAQLAALCQLCLDPYFRTTKGFMVLIEKEWCSFGHQFARRTGHRERNYSDDQRSCIFLQFLDCVHQLLHQFPRHFEFNSHMLVTICHHMYSCRFGTFLFNSDLLRRKNKLREKTVSLWTYLMCSPAAIAGEFTNPLYCSSGKGGLHHVKGVTPPQQQKKPAPKPAPTTPASPPAQSSPVDEWGGRSSVGRGGGDGSVTTMGAVLYPCWTQKSIRVWGDYFLRFTNEQCEQLPVPPAAGSVAPGGAATPRMYSSENLLQAEIRRVQREAADAIQAAEMRGQEKQRVLEAEVARLKRSLAAATAAAAAVQDSSSPFTMALGSVDSAGDLLFGAMGLGEEPPSPLASSPSVGAAAGAAATDSSPLASPTSPADESVELPSEQAAVLAALQHRLQRDVDVSVREDMEVPEDPRTL